MVKRQGIARGIISFFTIAVLGGLCIVFGIVPEKIVAAFITSPPSWVSHPLLKIGSLVAGGLLGVFAWRLWPWRKSPAGKLTERYPAANIDEWCGIDPLLLWQAGCLWGNIKPRSPVEFGNPAYAAFSMLLRAAEHGDLKLLKREPDPHFASSHVTRDELAKFAAKKERRQNSYGMLLCRQSENL